MTTGVTVRDQERWDDAARIAIETKQRLHDHEAKCIIRDANQRDIFQHFKNEIDSVEKKIQWILTTLVGFLLSVIVLLVSVKLKG